MPEEKLTDTKCFQLFSIVKTSTYMQMNIESVHCSFCVTHEYQTDVV